MMDIGIDSWDTVYNSYKFAALRGIIGLCEFRLSSCRNAPLLSGLEGRVLQGIRADDMGGSRVGAFNQSALWMREFIVLRMG